jgi:hypothetical protein
MTYIGVVQWDGVRYLVQHKPLVPRSLFDRVQQTPRARDVVGAPGTPRARPEGAALRGVRKAPVAYPRHREYLYFYCLGQR